MNYVLRMLFAITLVLFACQRVTSPRLDATAFQLQEAMTLVTESYLTLKLTRPVADATLRVYRNGQMLWQRPYTAADSIVYDSTLAPAHTYTYRAELWSGSRQLARSNTVTVTTMDTTRHDFEWEIIEFPSPYGSGALYDVAIINENDVWAVGEIYSDSTPPWLPYNAVHWDGKKWELKRIFYHYQGSDFIRPIPSMLAFDTNNIWFGNFTRWNGYFFESITLDIQFPSQINKMWGTSSSDLYIVGNGGLIAHYDGQRWQRIESGTKERGNDVWGVKYPDGTYTIFFAFSDSYKIGRHILLQTRDGVTLQLTDWPDNVYIESVWTDNPHYLYACGSGVWRRTIEGWQKYSGLPNVFRERIRGNSANDIFVVGHFGQILHYNGATWQIFQINPDIGIVEGLAVKGDMIYATGVSISTQSAFIIKGTRKK